jgi:hypothetical protein
MIIATKVKNEKTSDNNYPKLKTIKDSINGPFIVLFIERNSGMVVESNNSSHRIGDYCEYWGEEGFRDYEGELILKNG